MPAGQIKTKRDETLWKKAKAAVRKQYPTVKQSEDQFWALTNGIFQTMSGRKPKTAIAKSEFTSLAKEAAISFVADRTLALDDLVAKTAVEKGYNPDEIQNLCAALNHVVYASLAKNAADKEDGYIDFELARPENVLKAVADSLEEPDDIYNNTDSLFAPVKTAAEEKPSLVQFGNDLLRKGQVLEQNIKNIGLAHYQQSTKLAAENSHVEEQIDKLYQYVAQGVAGGKNPDNIKIAIGNVFDSGEDASMVWNYIESNLIANNVIKRPAHDTDRVNVTDSPDPSVMVPNANNGIVSVATELNRRMGRADQITGELDVLEKMAEEASKDLYKNLLLQKQAVVGTLVGGGIKLLGKGLTASVIGLAKGTTAVAKKTFKKPEKAFAFKKPSKGGMAVGTAFVGVDAVGGAGGKKIRVM